MATSTAESDQQLCRRFSLSEMKSATGDFSDAQVIGKGGFGKVYKGLIDNGSLTVAIKRLASNSNQGAREFAAEMETLTKFRHRNLVSLIGYCNEQKEMILVYEYMANGTLADHLYKLSRNDGSSLTWNQRLKICIGAGRGLDYLHSGCSIIHRDVKSTNILLDDNFTAKVSDFGLAKNLSMDMLERSFVSTNVKGSFGYFDPSYFTTGRLTKASDTYAFGVLLLEVLTGKPPIGRNLAEDELCMTKWAQEKIRNGKAEQIVALNLKGEISEGCLKTFVGVVKRCLLSEPKKRLTMTRAVAQLELALEQQEKKEMATPRILQLLPFWNRGSTEKDQNEVTTTAIEEERPAVPLAEIKDITNGFSSKCMIPNEFGGGIVFHGILKSGQHVAIEKLYKKLSDDEFIAQVSRLSKLKHDNVVELVGYCLGDDDLQELVYEFAPQGSLHEILHGRLGIEGLDLEPCPTLSWSQRLKIAVGIATGLCYIHEKGLIHHNIKSSNVLVFDGEIAKLTNLGPSTLHPCSCKVPNCDEHPCLPLSSGYHLPEYLFNQSRKGDVYSFGVVLLELLTGRKLLDCTRPVGERNIVSWAKPHLDSDKVHKIVDARFKADYPPNEVEKMAAVAKLCLQNYAECLPNMNDVLRDLKRIDTPNSSATNDVVVPGPSIGEESPNQRRPKRETKKPIKLNDYILG